MMTRGQLRVYLGAAPGVGKTYAMLDEGHRRASRGTDVVVAFVETYGRERTAAKIEGLEVVPRRLIRNAGSGYGEMDLPTVLARHPQVALVDELAHTNAPGVEHEKRWQDVEALLGAGIDVISTVNIQHLESLNDVVESITGIQQRETVPDAVVRAADQVELVDMTPEALRRRMAHGNIYTADKVDAALSNYFRAGNLTALRELALLWLADRVEEGLQRYRAEHGISGTWETRERIVVGLTGGPEGETLIRRAARIASRTAGADLLAVHVERSDGLAGSSVAALSQQRMLVEAVGGSYHSIVGDDIANAVLEFARANNATQIVLGASRRPWPSGVFGTGTGQAITRRAGPIDVHVVTHEFAGKGRTLPRLTRGLDARRRIAGVVSAAALLGLLTLVGTSSRGTFGIASDALLYLLVVVVVSVVGGFYPAMATALAASLLLNYYFVPPLHTFTISRHENVLAVIVFLVIAAMVSRVVDIAARRSAEAARSNAEAETLSTLAGSVLRGDQALPALLERILETFVMRSVSLLRRESEAPSSASADARQSGGLSGTWSCVAAAGDDPCMRPGDGDIEVDVTDELKLVLRGRVLAAEDQRVLTAFATHVAVAYQQRRLAEAAESVAPMAEADRMRTALLNAVSHDLRTPLASAKAAVSSLRNSEVAWGPQDQQELLANADAALDRLTALVTNLLDLSRLQAGVLSYQVVAIGLEDVVGQALGHIDDADRVDVDVPTTLPEVAGDPGLLERIVANLLDNALRYSPEGERVRLSASRHGNVVELRVIDHGPGVPPRDRDAVFAPFQRLDDHTSGNGAGVGLGLAIARGFVDAMHGSIALDDTPGGGLTAVVSMPVKAP